MNDSSVALRQAREIVKWRRYAIFAQKNAKFFVRQSEKHPELAQ
jgi:hypothetical protein